MAQEVHPELGLLGEPSCQFGKNRSQESKEDRVKLCFSSSCSPQTVSTNTGLACLVLPEPSLALQARTRRVGTDGPSTPCMACSPLRPSLPALELLPPLPTPLPYPSPILVLLLNQPTYRHAYKHSSLAEMSALWYNLVLLVYQV